MRSNKYYNQAAVINKEVRKAGPISSETIKAQTAVYELTNTIEVLPTLPTSYMGKANSNVSQADVRG